MGLGDPASPAMAHSEVLTQGLPGQNIGHNTTQYFPSEALRRTLVELPTPADNFSSRPDKA